MIPTPRQSRPKQGRSAGDLLLVALLVTGVALVAVGTVRLFAPPSGRDADETTVGSVVDSSAARGPKGAGGAATPGLDPVALAPILLATLPNGTVVEDARFEWPGPALTIRGHAVTRPGMQDEFEAWSAKAAASGWFRRLQSSPDDSLVVFEYCLKADRSNNADPPDTARDRRKRMVFDPAWDSVLVSLSTDATRLSRLEDRTKARWTVGYRGNRGDLLGTLQAVEARHLPIQRAWLGPATETSRVEWELRLKIGRTPGGG